VGVPLGLPELLEFLEAALVEPLGVRKEAFILEERLVPLGKLLLEPQGPTADDVGRGHVLGEVKRGGVLEHPDGGGVLGVHLQDLHAPLSGEGVNLLQERSVGEAVLLVPEVSA
jgi:hypothetical protein